MSVYEKMGVKRVINALGPATLLGGSTLSKEVIDAMIEANTSFVDMLQLQNQSGKILAEITGAEAGWVTPGTYAALILSAAACMAGKDVEKIKRLPDTRGLKNEVIIQTHQRYFYDDAIEVPGGRLVPVGDESNCSPEMIEAAINDKTAAILYLAVLGGPYPISMPPVSLEEAVKIGKRNDVPVIVDAACNIYPLKSLTKYIAMRCDLVCYGGKYFGAPHSTGFVVGRKDLIDSVALQSFIGYECRGRAERSGSLGRGYKLDRQEIVALVVALQNWMEIDHKKRLEALYKKVRYLKERLRDTPGIKTEDTPDRPPSVGFRIILENRTHKETSELCEKELRGGKPSIWMRTEGNSLIVNVISLLDGEEKSLADVLEQVLMRK